MQFGLPVYLCTPYCQLLGLLGRWSRQLSREPVVEAVREGSSRPGLIEPGGPLSNLAMALVWLHVPELMHVPWRRQALVKKGGRGPSINSDNIIHHTSEQQDAAARDRRVQAEGLPIERQARPQPKYFLTVLTSFFLAPQGKQPSLNLVACCRFKVTSSIALSSVSLFCSTRFRGRVKHSEHEARPPSADF